MSVVDYKVAGGAASLSPAIWADLPSMKQAACPADFIEIYDDFVRGGVVADTSVPGWNLVGTNADVDQVVDEADGLLILEGSGADNDSAFISSADLCLLKRNSGKKFWFEARVKLSATTGDYAAFVGLVEGVGATAELIADNGATVIDEDFVGFFADTNATVIQPWNCTINQGGSGNFPVDVKANALAISTDFVKFGLKFDGKHTLDYYINGAKAATYDIGNLDNDTMAHEVRVAIGLKQCATASSQVVTVDWVRFVAEKVAQGY